MVLIQILAVTHGLAAVLGVTTMETLVAVAALATTVAADQTPTHQQAAAPASLTQDFVQASLVTQVVLMGSQSKRGMPTISQAQVHAEITGRL
jgi:predicted cobalt transporter CbtA